MKMFPKMQDDTIDRLLRAQGGAAGKELPPCREFDADLANAYVERRLKESERANYESHLAACSPCRKAIVALTRLAEAAQVAAPMVATVAPARGASSIRQWLGVLTAPQWAMVAAAVIVFAVSLPLMLSHRTTPVNEIPTAQEPASPPSSVDGTARAAAPATAPGESASPASARDANAQGRAETTEKPAPAGKAEAQAQPTDVASGASGGAAVAQSGEAKLADQAAAKTEAAAPPSPAPVAEPAKPQATDDARNQATAKDEAKDAKQDKEKRADSDVAIAPPPPPPSRGSEPARARERDEVSASVPGMQPFRTPTDAAAATPSVTRKISGHQFLLRGNVWMDKDYNPEKDVRVIPVIRDSDVYHDLLAKDAKIKPFLTYFPTDARVIFKFKGVVYKLIPQDADR